MQRRKDLGQAERTHVDQDPGRKHQESDYQVKDGGLAESGMLLSFEKDTEKGVSSPGVEDSHYGHAAQGTSLKAGGAAHPTEEATAKPELPPHAAGAAGTGGVDGAGGLLGKAPAMAKALAILAAQLGRQAGAIKRLGEADLKVELKEAEQVKSDLLAAAANVMQHIATLKVVHDNSSMH